jgi:hypothetical protein
MEPPPPSEPAIGDPSSKDDATGRTKASFPAWIAYVVAVGLMALGIAQAVRIGTLKSQLAAASADADQLRQSNAFLGLRLATLGLGGAAKGNAAYVSAQVLVAWDPYRNRGVVSTQNLPSAPTGYNYDLWVLDPGAEAPIGAGLITPEDGSHVFTVRQVSMGAPGFVVSLEPGVGGPVPTGPILFAVAPGQ